MFQYQITSAQNNCVV